MSLFQCQHCGCCENTALAAQSIPALFKKHFDWTGIEDRQDMQLCSACGPTRFRDGTPSGFGVWHGRFERTFLPKGMFRTNQIGNLAHVETGDEGYRKYAIAQGDGV